jgi:hypothetical protein
VFNETVVAYSHDNIHSFSHTFSDHLNVQSLLWLSGSASYSKDVSFLNIDSLGMQPCYDDKLSEYFNYYSKSFRRILKAVDFGTSSKVCFKNLIMQPKPEIQFTRDGWKQDLRCPQIGPSTIYQRWNIEMRDNSGLLNTKALQTNEIFTILLISKASKIGSRVNGKNDGGGEKSNLFSIDKSPSGQGISNVDGLQTILSELVDSISMKNTDIFIEIIIQDFDLLSFEEQVLLIAKSSLVIGLHGTGIAISMHMAVGTKYCCGVIEIFPGDKRDKRFNGTNDMDLKIKKENKYRNLKGHENMVRRMGIQYERLNLIGGFKSDDNKRIVQKRNLASNDINEDKAVLPAMGIYVSPLALQDKIKNMIERILIKPSCFLPAVVKKKL